MKRKMRLILTALSSVLAAGAANPSASDSAALTVEASAELSKPAPDNPTTTNPPNIVGLESISFTENSPAPIATYTARDAQGYSIIWSLAGRDAEAFTFTTDKEHQTITLFFRSIPDYEQPADVPPTDNDYQVTVVATVPGLPALATSYPVRVQVVDVEEGSAMPVLTAPEQIPSTQAESVGRMVRAVVHFYKDVVGWALRGVFHHLRDVFNASKRPPVPELPDAPEVSVYAGALSALETSGRLHVLVGKPASAITGYEYQLYEGEDRLLDWTSAGIAGPTGAASSFSVGGLQHGQPYAVAVRAVNEGGASGAVWGIATPGRLFAPDWSPSEPKTDDPL